ncbi:ABC transporter-like protein [Scytonema sp. HK-05]|uniref:ABC transporter ATP-binding protein n=1 Tax=Scytonema sp. HK-05 TaxID=1137095 RepID=UPI0009374EB2|nr:ABC transporter ATP-binding protein [Scytonema sp. HK-05]OKH59691.1 ABC transporter ATP-binding protein [Scytonema sp. HK-05]BAY47906.1 ABC transporter-like protein [Scytonema sp. HK-05]
MSDTVIRVENLAKKYVITHQEEGSIRYKTFRGAITNATKSFAGALNPHRAKNKANASREEFWALKDVSFEIKQGDRVGIMGRNGAGKSTLLKILSRITEPTSGSIRIKGRVASLLEVGTGFHPELTGRENIFLNGAILGMSKVEIQRKFDEIVAFAEVEKFLDTPVKRYSSGMYVRLAFAVAAHLEPEILIVDEVLAVGDAQFQKKCLGKMEDVGKEGRTVLFVSHNMAALESLCDKGILLKSGKVLTQGQARNVVKEYIKSYESSHEIHISQRTDRQGNGLLTITDFDLLTDDKKLAFNTLSCGQQILFQIKYQSKINDFYGNFQISIYDEYELRILALNTSTVNQLPLKLSAKGQITVGLSKEFSLSPGQYTVNVSAFINEEMADYVQGAIIFNVVEGDFFGSGKLPTVSSQCLVKQFWAFEKI